MRRGGIRTRSPETRRRSASARPPLTRTWPLRIKRYTWDLGTPRQTRSRKLSSLWPSWFSSTVAVEAAAIRTPVSGFDAGRTSAFGRKPFKLLYFQGRIPARHPATELSNIGERIKIWVPPASESDAVDFDRKLLRNIFPEILPICCTRVGLDRCAKYPTGRTLTGGQPVIRWRAGRCEIFREAFRRVALCDPFPVGFPGAPNSIPFIPQGAPLGRAAAWRACVHLDRSVAPAGYSPAPPLNPRFSLPFASLLVAARGHASFAREKFA